MSAMTAPAFKLCEIAAAGTFGTVCVVRDLHTGKLVALKVLKRAHLNRPRVIARTRDEAQMLSKIDHPNIVHVDELIDIGDRPVVVMEWVRGVSLEELIKHHRDGLPLPVAVELIRAATIALAAAYETEVGGKAMRIIHRDVKPSNMILSIDGDMKMVDFGIARADFEGKEAKTMSMVLGARGYLAPERLDGHDDKPSVDIYSLGVCLYELATGRHIVLSVHHTFHAEALEKNLKKLTPPGLSDEGVAQLQGIVEAMCRYDEAKRPGHRESVEMLDKFLRDQNLVPDLKGYARATVLPMFESRERVRPIDHPGYPDLAFLERTAANTDDPAPPDIDLEIAAFLKDPNWPDRLSELDLMLVKNPHWSAVPFLDLLPEGVKPWWQFWGKGLPNPKQLKTLLTYLQRRPTPDAIQRATTLQGHPDADVVDAANTLVSMG